MTDEITQVVGRRHERPDGRDCNCGCKSVEGITGAILPTEDNAKLRDLGLVVATFSTQYGKREVAYDLDELA